MICISNLPQVIICSIWIKFSVFWHHPCTNNHRLLHIGTHSNFTLLKNKASNISFKHPTKYPQFQIISTQNTYYNNNLSYLSLFFIKFIQSFSRICHVMFQQKFKKTQKISIQNKYFNNYLSYISLFFIKLIQSFSWKCHVMFQTKFV